MLKKDIITKVNKKFKNALSTELVEDANSKNGYKVTLICKLHGSFTKNIYDILNGGKYGCPICNRAHANDWHKTTINDFIQQAKKIHKNYYDYSLVDFKTLGNMITIICPKHGEVKIIAGNHLGGRKCRKCANELIHIQQRNSIDDILNRFKKIHQGRYDYSKVNYKGMWHKVEIVCSDHGSFWMVAVDHISGNGCPKCSMSSLEAMTEEWLKNNKYNYVYQYKDDRCRIQKPLPFDFGILEKDNTLSFLIECQGIFHYKPVYSEKDFNRIKNSDKVKKNFCKNNNIPLIQLPYWEFNHNFDSYITNIVQESII